MRTIWTMNQLTIYHAVSICYNQVQKMHQCRPEVAPESSDNDGTTLRANYVAMKRYPQPSLKARCDSVRLQQLPKTYPMKAVPSMPAMTYSATENRQWHTLLAVDYVSDEPLSLSKKMTTLLRRSPMLREPDGAIHWQIILDHIQRIRPPLDGHSGSGRDAQNTDQTRSGSSIASTSSTIRSTHELFKDTLVEQKNQTRKLKSGTKIHVDGPNYCIILDLLMITCLSWKEVLSQEQSAVKKGRQACFFAAVDPMNIPMLTPLSKKNEPQMKPYNMKWRSAVFWFDLRTAQEKRLTKQIDQRAMRYCCITHCQPKVG